MQTKKESHNYDREALGAAAKVKACWNGSRKIEGGERRVARAPFRLMCLEALHVSGVPPTHLARQDARTQWPTGLLASSSVALSICISMHLLPKKATYWAPIDNAVPFIFH